MAYGHCLNCGEIWSPGTEEFDWQKCSACGWSPGQPLDDEEDFEEDDYSEDDLDGLFEKK